MFLICRAARSYRAGVHAERAAIEANVIILCLPPDAARVVLIIDLALLVLLGETLLRCLLRLAVALDDAAGAAGHVGTDEHMQAVLPVAQDIVRAAADDDALALFRQLLDDLALRDIELIVHGEVVVAVALGRGQIEQQAVAGVAYSPCSSMYSGAKPLRFATSSTSSRS